MELVDTGAVKSCTSKNARRRLRKVLEPPMDGQFLRMGNQELVRPLGYCTTSVRVEVNRYVLVFIVLPYCIADVILGCDFLSARGPGIDFSNRVLHSTSFDFIDLVLCSPKNTIFVAPKTTICCPQYLLSSWSCR